MLDWRLRKGGTNGQKKVHTGTNHHQTERSLGMLSHSIIVSGGVRLSPVSTRNTDEPSRGSFKIRISEPSREAAKSLLEGKAYLEQMSRHCINTSSYQ